MMQDIDSETLERLWGGAPVRVFVSHTHDHKVAAKEIKDRLGQYGVASFVAHEDIEPVREWEDEIESALFSMNLLVALLTEGFSVSKWTDQEVGVALGRGVPIIPIRMGKDPYGFIGRYQAIAGNLGNSGMADAIFDYALRNNSVKASAIDSYVKALKDSPNFDRSNLLAKKLSGIDALSPGQEEALVTVFNQNPQVNASFGFRGTRPAYHGEGLAHHLLRLTGNEYVYVSGEIVKASTLTLIDDSPL